MVRYCSCFGGELLRAGKPVPAAEASAFVDEYGKLRAGLRTQVKRMLADARAQALTMYLRNLKNLNPDPLCFAFRRRRRVCAQPGE